MQALSLTSTQGSAMTYVTWAVLSLIGRPPVSLMRRRAGESGAGAYPPGVASRVSWTRDVGPGDAGMRVTLRSRTADGGLTDVLGVLERWSDDEVLVRDRHGVLHTVAPEAVVAAKRIPPPPERR